jgi:AcrR family transcriptional regulator
MTDQRANILASACDLYLAEGLDGLSMRKLAREVGVTAPALYRYYESKEHVLLDVVNEAFREFRASLYQALEGRTPLDRLFRARNGYVRFALEHPRWYRMVFITPEQLGVEALPEELEAHGCAIHQFWVDRLRECMEAGFLREDDPVEVALTMWAHSHGMVTLYQNGLLEMDEEGFHAAFQASSARMMRGMGTAAMAEALAGCDALEEAGIG